MSRADSLLGSVMIVVLLLSALASSSLAASSSSSEQQQALSTQSKSFNASFSTPTVAATQHRRHSFTIAEDAFRLDGEQFTLLSGEIHYFRIPSHYWRDRLRRVRALGFNAVTVYVPWNFHQPESPDSFDFSGDRNLTRFLDLAAQEDLFVIMRPPPYVCAEWDFGGMPAWLADPKAVKGGGLMTLRSSQNPEFFLAAVERWYETLLPMLSPYLIESGGPILMVQVENEFGNGGAPDVPYLESLASMTRRHLGSDEVLLFTTDAPRFLVNGSVPFEEIEGVDKNFVAMIDSGAGWNASDLDATFAPLRKTNAPGATPFFSSELYDGWVQFNGAGFEVTNVSIARVASRMEGLLERGGGGGGLSLYMAAGGSNFGFNAGGSANDEDDSFAAIIQSYDYAAPISEGGSSDKQPGYGGPPRASAVRAVLEKFSAAAKPFSSLASSPSPSPSSSSSSSSPSPSSSSSSPSSSSPSSSPSPSPSSSSSSPSSSPSPSPSPSSSSSSSSSSLPSMPADPPVAAYGRVELTQRATLLSALPQLSRSREPILAVCPLPSELFGLNRGFISYSTKIPRALLASAGGALFEVGNNATVHDIGTVLIDGVAQGTLDRGKGLGEGGSKLRLKEELALANDRNNNSTSAAFAELSVIVGMTGRSNQGTFFDTKGLNGSVLIDGEEIEGEWEVWPLPLDDAEKVTKLDLASLSSSSSSLLTVEESGPLLLRGTFEVSAEQAEASSVGEWEGEEGEEEVGEEDGKVGRRRRRRHPADTYFAFDGLSRGVVFVNGVALGWYDLVEGPQMRVFVPGVWLKRGTNDVLVLEMLSASSDGGVSAVESVLEPDFFGPPKKKNDGGQEEKQKEKKKSAASVEGAAAAAAAASEVETSTSSLLRFPGAGSLRTIEAASATT